MKTTQLLLIVLMGFAGLAQAESFTSSGNIVVPLKTGAELNAKRLKLVRNADKFIYLKTFIINSDPSEASVYEALCERAKEGLDVRMLVDDLGRRQGGNPIKMKKGEFSIKWFKSCGIRFERYGKPSWGPIDFIIYSQHDKMMVSEKAAIMGGTNYSRDYSAHAQFSKQWYDFDISLEGPASCSLQKIFNQSWVRALGQEFVGIKKILGKKRRRRVEERFSAGTLVEECHSTAVGSNDVTVIFNDPKFSKERPFEDYVISSLNEVKKSGGMTVSLYAPYFIPNKKVMASIIEAAKSGVKIRIITNSKTSIDPEAFPAYVAMLLRVRPLLESGVEMYLWNPSKFQQSALDKDNVFHKKGGCFGTLNCFVGSHNLDVRGDKYSSELMAVLSDQSSITERNESFENDLMYTVPLDESSRKNLLKDSKITDKIIARIAGWAM